MSIWVYDVQIIAFTYLKYASSEEFSPDGGGVIFVEWQSFLTESNEFLTGESA